MGAGLNAPVTGAIVAGGSATRLGGVAKGLLDVGGVRIIDRVAQALVPSVDSLVIAANTRDAASWIPGTRVVPDTLVGGGSAAGIHAALVAAGTPVIAVAWDLPFVNAKLIALIAALGDASVADAVVCAGPRGGEAEPLCAWYAPACVGVIESQWREGDRSVHGLLSRVRTTIVSAQDTARCGAVERLFFNVNSPEDVMMARAMAMEART